MRVFLRTIDPFFLCLFAVLLKDDISEGASLTPGILVIYPGIHGKTERGNLILVGIFLCRFICKKGTSYKPTILGEYRSY